MTKEEIYKRADIYVKNQPLVNANNVELKRGFYDGAIWMQKELDEEMSNALFIQSQMLIEKAVAYIMTHSTYAVQPEVYADGLKKAMMKGE